MRLRKNGSNECRTLWRGAYLYCRYGTFLPGEISRGRDPDSKDPAAILGFDVKVFWERGENRQICQSAVRQKEGGKYGTADVQSTD